MGWRIGWIVCSMLALGACEGSGKAAGDGDTAGATGAATDGAEALAKLTDAMPSSVSATRPEAKTGDDPKTDYRSFDEVYTAQTDAVGKTLLLRGYGSPTAPDTAFLSEAKPSSERANTLELRFQSGQRDLIRALPSSQYVRQGECPRIHVRITGFDAKKRHPQGELVDIYDLQPDPPPASLPAGIDFVSIDDVFLAGPAAVGRVVDFGVHLGARDASAESWVLNATGCSPHGGYNAQLFVAENDANRSFFESLKAAGVSTCVRIRAKIIAAPRESAPTRWRAELLGVGEQYRKPHPEPNP